MATIKDLKKYVNYEFSSGCYTGDDYKSFQTKYINYLKSICNNVIICIFLLIRQNFIAVVV